MASEVNTFEPHITDMYEFERTFDQRSFLAWAQENWTSSFVYSIIYVALVFGGRWYMTNKPRFELRIPLAIWSGGLAIFSIMGAARTIPELIFMVRVNGFEGSVCDPSYCSNGPTAVWVSLMTVSKLYEFGDTAFIVLRKQPLMFLHWYHHVTVFIYAWYSYSDETAPVRWFVVMNYTVHAFMYTYYTIRAMKFRLPKAVNIFITSLQITQMAMGIIIQAKAYLYKSQGHFCQQSWANMRFSCIMYISYLLLFAHFFYKAYLKPKPSIVKPKATETRGNLATGSELLDSHLYNDRTSPFNNNFVNGKSKKID